MDSRIGQLTRDGRTVFYAYTNGYAQEPFEGTLEQVEIELGLHLGAAELDLDEPARAPIKASRTAWDVRSYAVTITPRYAIWCGGQEFAAYTVEIDGRSSNAAIKKACAEHNENHWNNPARYRAILMRNA